MAGTRRPATIVAIITAGAIVALITAWSTITKEPSPFPSPSPPATTVVIYGPPPRAPATTLGVFPQTTQDVVVKFGGTVDEWMALPPNGWVYRGSTEAPVAVHSTSPSLQHVSWMIQLGGTDLASMSKPLS
jgi:hypothetical protein